MQKKISHDFENQDVLSVDHEKNYGVGVLFRIRNGHLISIEKFNLLMRSDNRSDIIEQFLLQYYSVTYDLPDTILLEDDIIRSSEYSKWLSDRKGTSVKINIPIKDCALMSRMRDPELRRRWRKRIMDHDGSGVNTSGEASDKEYFKQKLNTEDEGGIERWLLLTDSLGLDRDYVKSTEGILPITRFAVDAYVTFVNEKSVLEGVTSSLSELFAPDIHR